MARRRTRRRHRGRRQSGTALLVVAVAVALVGAGVPGAAFDAGHVDRPASIAVVGDPDGALALNLTSALAEGSTGCLVGLTNHLGQSASVTVSLRDDSTDLGTLEVGGDDPQSGDSVSVTLDRGASVEVSMAVETGTAGDVAAVDVHVTASGLAATLTNRTAPIETEAGSTCE